MSPHGCLCQQYGKTGVPNRRGLCLVCGLRVWTVRDAVTEDRCRHCGQLLGIGLPALHVGICEACAEAQGDA